MCDYAIQAFYFFNISSLVGLEGHWRVTTTDEQVEWAL